MKKILLIALLLTGVSQAQIVNIPDAAFKNQLIVNNVDTNGDGEIQLSEAQSTHLLYMTNGGISDLTGIAAFVNLEVLYCDSNALTAIDITGLSHLVVLYINNNQITSLDLSMVPQLFALNCSQNQLTSLDLSATPLLNMLNCSQNQLAALNVNSFVQLKEFDCSFNALTTLGLQQLSAVENLRCDNNQITALDVSDLVSLKELYVNHNNLQSLTGLTQCTHIEKANCSQNQLTTLDVSNLTTLFELNCSQNQLSAINFENNSFIDLNCGVNQMTSFDLTGIYASTFNCGNNLLTTLDLSNFPVSGLDCGGNQLTSLILDTSMPENLTRLVVSNNLLTNIDLLPYNNLIALSCYNNPMTTLTMPAADIFQLSIGAITTAIDLSAFPHLMQLQMFDTPLSSVNLLDAPHMQYLDILSSPDAVTIDVSAMHFLSTFQVALCPNLTSINMKNGSQYTSQLNFGALPALQNICANENDINYINYILTSNSITDVAVSSYCTFTPGGSYNTIAGMSQFDADNNGCDVNDVTNPFIKMTINDGSIEGATFTNGSGNYTFYTGAGNFTLTPEIENPSFFNINPVTAVVDFPLDDNSVSTQNVCISANGIHPDLEIVIAPIIPARPGFDAVYKITYKNKGNQILSQDYGVSFFYNQNLMELVSTDLIPATNSPGALTWSYTNLLPFESRSIYVTVNVNAPTDANPVNIGSILDFNANISPVAGDESMADNYSVFHQTVVGSFDPNDITCIEGETVPPSEIGNYLHYVINFENTGTDYAQNIVVKNIIDPEKFDIASLQILSSSHTLDARVNGNILELIFKNINLDTGGHGNVLLKIKTNDELVSGNSVAAKGDIYFDYNFPVSTNIATTIFQTLGIDANPLDESITIYPNPTHDIVSVKANNTIKSIQLFDVQGRLLQTRIANENNANIDISNHSNGIYFLKITSEKGIKIEKIIKK
ncbi:MAG: T9SS type A sorting domain-containing protein [Flavobacterium sp.]|nr:T9SS type A sorting domain-containing protein [Flavobacterium sp.]